MEVSNFIASRASSRLQGRTPEGEKEDWPEAGSLFMSSESSFVSSILKGASECSSRYSLKRQDADAAASQAVLEVLEEQNKEQLEIQLLEAQVKKKIADQEAAAAKRRLEQEAEEVKQRIKREEEEATIKAQLEEEHGALQKTLQEKQKKIKQLEAVKSLKVARARMKVYNQEKVIEDQKDFLKMSPEPQALTTSSSNESTADLVKVLVGALSAHRIPVPEPSVFSGDPLKYSDWKLYFETLIDQKYIQDKEMIYYLRRYGSGQAKKALDGYFLLGTESAYAAAWDILEERYGNPFTIAKSFRDKLQAWHKMGSRDSFELREFVDFLRSCEAAMVHVKALEILNDYNENRKILSKLPEWLKVRWNRKVIEIEEEINQFPSFSQER